MLSLIQRADRAARDFDPRITQVRVGFSDELRRILIAASDGTFASDTQPLARLNVFVIAQDGSANEGAGSTTRGTSGGGGRVTLDFFEGAHSSGALCPRGRAHRHPAAQRHPAPAREMLVVLGPGWPGVLLHEAVGHGLEADFNRKKTSAFAGLIGQKVASEKVTVVDNGQDAPIAAAPSMWTTRATPTQETVLIEERNPAAAISSDKLSARLMGALQHRLRPPRELSFTSPCRA